MTTLSKLEAAAASDRAAAVDIMLDKRPDLTPSQRRTLRATGISQGPAFLRRFLADVLPAKAPPTTQGATFAKAMPSGDAKVDRLFRIMPEASDTGGRGDGVTINPRPGVLVSMSVVGAMKTIRAHTERNLEEARAKMKPAASRSPDIIGRILG
jgi:hypothetical protein